MKVLYGIIMLMCIFAKTYGMEISPSIAERKQTIQENGSKKTYPCEVCSKTFGTKGILKIHMNAHTGKKYPCTICGKEFTQQGNVRTHMKRVHEKKRRYTCDDCGHTFFATNDLKTHVVLVHQGQEEKSYKCDYCNGAFNSLGRLNEHKERHEKAQMLEKDEIIESGVIEQVPALSFLASVAQSEQARGTEPRFFQALEEASRDIPTLPTRTERSVAPSQALRMSIASLLNQPEKALSSTNALD